MQSTSEIERREQELQWDDVLTSSERFGTNIITETVARVDLSQRPFKFWVEGEEEEADFLTADT